MHQQHYNVIMVKQQKSNVSTNCKITAEHKFIHNCHIIKHTFCTDLGLSVLTICFNALLYVSHFHPPLMSYGAHLLSAPTTGGVILDLGCKSSSSSQKVCFHF